MYSVALSSEKYASNEISGGGGGGKDDAYRFIDSLYSSIIPCTACCCSASVSWFKVSSAFSRDEIFPSKSVPFSSFACFGQSLICSCRVFVTHRTFLMSYTLQG